MTGAIIIIGAEVADLSSENALCAAAPVAHVPYWFVEVLGCSLLERTIQNLRRCGIEKVSILVDKKWKDGSAEIGAIVSRPLRWVENAWAAAEDELRAFQADGIDRSLMMSATSYAELDLAELLQFHDEQKKDVTTVSSRNLPLDLWVVNVRTFRNEFPLDRELNARACGSGAAQYSARGYVNLLQSARELRRVVSDSFNAACRLCPYGQEMRPGVWIGEAAEVHRAARIVAPAFIGRGSKIEEQCLITRCSNIESNCLIDYGTVVEDSYILANTYVGIGLDITHSVVRGNTLVNLERNVALQIADQGVIRPNRVLRKEASRSSSSSLRLVGTH